nr:MAG TPA: hypothetical protein [Caudoviricetes sp.]
MIKTITFRVDSTTTICDYLAISRKLVAKRNRLAGSLTLMGLSRRNAGTKE